MFTMQSAQNGRIPLLILIFIPVFFNPAHKSVFNGKDNLVLQGTPLNSVVINELLYRRKASGQPEFIELFNTGSLPINLGGWLLADSEKSSLLPDGIAIQPGGYVVLADQKSFSNISANIHYLPSWPGFSNAGDAVVLKNPEGLVADSIRYSSEWGSPGPGVSLERKDPSAISRDPSNWSISTSPSGSTPNEINTAFTIDRIGPQIRFTRLLDQSTVEVRFSEFIAIAEDTRFRVNGAPADVQVYDPEYGNIVTLSLNPANLDSELIIRAEQIQDFQENITPATELPLARRPKAGDLVLNEIMYQELPYETDSGLVQSEYLEIANSRQYTVSLEGVSIREAPDEQGLFRTLELTDSRHKYLRPDEYAIIYPEAEDLPYHLSRTGLFFGADSQFNRRALRADRMTLSLVNSGKELFLTDSVGTVLDYLRYDPFWHNPNLIDARGISLERISRTGPSNNADNWTSSSAEKGGTPAANNSVSPDPNMVLRKSGKIELHPNPFSPDADGFDDTLFIQYEFEEPDYLLAVRILDRYGRPIRKLADNYRAGISGELQWDGLSDDGSRNRIGIYVLWLEAYHASNGSREVFRDVFVLARTLN
jgi:hypothetical protein